MEESAAQRTLVFDPVWLILKRPRPNLSPPQFLAPGRLTVTDQGAEFGPSAARLSWPSALSDARLTMDHIVGASRRRYGWGLLPRLVAISYESPEGAAVAYFNDGAWRGWRSLLTGSNRRMASAIRRHLGLP
jgi:hypothetical protein